MPPPSSSRLPLLAFLLLALVAVAHGQAVNGMDMSMDNGMSLASGTMMPMLHFSPIGDTLFFEGWVPQTRAAVFGACVGLFILTLVEAVRSMAEASWCRSAVKLLDRDNDNKDRKTRFRLHLPPFALAHDAMRGAMHALQALLGFIFMLAVMTFQGAYLITIVCGLGVGEILFGRYHTGGGSGH
ncbi:CTR copper uptake transporter [Mycena pura]|uniref:Copper transport protein n=1 Tax=Mycena pura TaxID=153505 RepID=A0AAD6YK59_9AGAR|nr:CTR copper uptake transporter [Mycena pura]